MMMMVKGRIQRSGACFTRKVRTFRLVTSSKVCLKVKLRVREAELNDIL